MDIKRIAFACNREEGTLVIVYRNGSGLEKLSASLPDAARSYLEHDKQGIEIGGVFISSSAENFKSLASWLDLYAPKQ